MTDFLDPNAPKLKALSAEQEQLANRARGVSRQAAKRMFNMTQKVINATTDGMERHLTEALDELQATRQRLEIVQNERAWLVTLLVACVQRSGGSIVFDRGDLLALVDRRELVPEMLPDRVTLKTRAKLQEVSGADKR